MSDKTYKLIKAICFIIIAGSSVYIAMGMKDINNALMDLVEIILNK